MKRNNLLEIRNLTISLPNTKRNILNKFSLSLQEGDFLVLLGSNGSGKSSLIKAIQGLYKVDKGEILLNNIPLTNRPVEEISKQVVTLTQDLSLSTFGNLTVLENCILAKMRNHSLFSLSQVSKQETEAFRAHLARFNPNLSQKLDTPANRLSGGERQTLALSMCLINRPVLLLLDEHTSALDPKTASQVMNLTQRFIEEQKIPTIMTTHHLDDALAYGNRVVAVKEGHLAFEADAVAKKKLSKSDLLDLCY